MSRAARVLGLAVLLLAAAPAPLTPQEAWVESCPSIVPADPDRPVRSEWRREADRLDLAAVQAAAAGDLEGARDLLRRAAMLDPASHTAAYHLGWILERLGETERAAEAYCRALALSPPPPDSQAAAVHVAGLLVGGGAGPGPGAATRSAPRRVAGSPPASFASPGRPWGFVLPLFLLMLLGGSWVAAYLAPELLPALARRSERATLFRRERLAPMRASAGARLAVRWAEARRGAAPGVAAQLDHLAGTVERMGRRQVARLEAAERRLGGSVSDLRELNFAVARPPDLSEEAVRRLGAERRSELGLLAMVAVSATMALGLHTVAVETWLDAHMGQPAALPVPALLGGYRWLALLTGLLLMVLGSWKHVLVRAGPQVMFHSVIRWIPHALVGAGAVALVYVYADIPVLISSESRSAGLVPGETVGALRYAFGIGGAMLALILAGTGSALWSISSRIRETHRARGKVLGVRAVERRLASLRPLLSEAEEQLAELRARAADLPRDLAANVDEVLGRVDDRRAAADSIRELAQQMATGGVTPPQRLRSGTETAVGLVGRGLILAAWALSAASGTYLLAGAMAGAGGSVGTRYLLGAALAVAIGLSGYLARDAAMGIPHDSPVRARLPHRLGQGAILVLSGMTLLLGAVSVAWSGARLEVLGGPLAGAAAGSILGLALGGLSFDLPGGLIAAWTMLRLGALGVRVAALSVAGAVTAVTARALAALARALDVYAEPARRMHAALGRLAGPAVP